MYTVWFSGGHDDHYSLAKGCRPDGVNFYSSLYCDDDDDFDIYTKVTKLINKHRDKFLIGDLIVVTWGEVSSEDINGCRIFRIFRDIDNGSLTVVDPHEVSQYSVIH